MLLKRFGVENEVVTSRVAFWLYDRIDEVFLLLFCHINYCYVRIDHVVLYSIITHIRAFSLQLQVLFEVLEFQAIGLVFLKVHVLGKDHVFGDFCPDFVEVAIVEEPVLGE